MFADTEDPKLAEETELANALRETLAPKLDTGVFDRLGGAPPRIVPARLGADDLGTVPPDLAGIPVLEGVFARGGAALAAAA